MTHDSSQPSLPGVSAREIELKLHVEPEHLARLMAHPTLLAMAESPAATRRQVTTYYDTPDLRLASLGVALRLRRQDDGATTQGVKTFNSAAAGDNAAVAVRREWEWPLTSDQPNFQVLEAPGVNQLVPTETLPKLSPVFVTDIYRTVVPVCPDPQSAVEIAFDRGVVRAGNREHPVSEIELELRRGSIGLLFDLALTLQDIVPLRIAGGSKAEVGYGLVTGRPPAPSRSEPMALSPATTVAEAFRHIVRHCLRQLLANEDCALAALEIPGGGDLAAVRHMRYALRRLRHGLDLFEPVIASPAAERFVEQSRSLGRRLGPARHWAVVGPALRQAGFALTDGEPPPGTDTAAYRAATDTAKAAILAPEFTTLVLSCGGWLEQDRWCEQADEARRQDLQRPIAELAPPWLDRLLRKARKVGYERNDPELLQQLSRRLRRLFDAADVFRGLFPLAQTRPFMAALAELRNPLDEAVDLAGSLTLLNEAGAPRDRQRTAVLERRIAETQGQLPEAWRRFKLVQPFWVKI